MPTARELVTNALVTATVVAEGETPSDAQIKGGLHRLNLLISSLNTQDLWSFTTLRKEYSGLTSKSEYTIGVGNGRLINSIGLSVDKFYYTVNTRFNHGILAAQNITIRDTTNYNDIINYPMAQRVDNDTINIRCPWTVPVVNYSGNGAIGTIQTTGLDPSQVYAVNDVIIVKNLTTILLTGIVTGFTGTIINVTTSFDGNVNPTSNTVFASVSSYAPDLETETVGYMYTATDSIPDLAQQRPDQINQVQIYRGDYWVPITEYTPDSWEDRVLGNPGTSLPTAFTYYPDFPFGHIKFNWALGSYPIRIVSKYKILEYTLDDQLNLPDGYEFFLEYQLAVNSANILLGRVDPETKEQAIEALAAIKRVHLAPSLMENDYTEGKSGHYDGLTDTWY